MVRRLRQGISIVALLLIVGGAKAATCAANPASKWVVFEGTTNAEYSDWGIWAVRSDGSDAHQIKPDTQNNASPQPSSAVVSPDGLEVAYVMYEYHSKEYCIEVTSIEGGRSAPVYCTITVEHLAWSPNGYELAFDAQTGEAEGRAIFIVNLRTDAVRKVADWVGAQESPTFSPDGSQLAFHSDFNPEGELEPGIWLVDSAGGTIRHLANGGKEPAWSPSGSQIAVESYDEESPNEDEGAIALLNSSTGEREKWLLSEDGPEEFDPQWSPDGESLFFTRCSEIGCVVGSINPEGTIESYPFSKFYEERFVTTQETTGTIEPDLSYLLQRYAPRLHYDIQEQYFADSAEEATNGPENRILASNKETVLAAHEPGYPTPALSLLAEPEYAHGYIAEGPKYAEDAAYMHAKPQYANKGYGRVFKDPTTGVLWLDYWFYYYYDSQEVLGIGVHEGDWETIALRLNGEDIPDLAVYSRHASESAACKSTAVQWELTSPAAVSPVSYVANGSHANYFTAGEHEREFPLPTDDANGNGAVVTPEVSEVESAPYNSSTALPRWIYWTGKWGASGGGGLDQESPSSPARDDDRWEDLETFAEESESNCEVGNSTEAPLRERESHLPQPAAPGIEAQESKAGILIHYTIPPGEPIAKYLLLSVSARDQRDATRTKTILVTARTRNVRLPRPLAAGPYVAAASTFTAQKERSHTTVVDVTRP